MQLRRAITGLLQKHLNKLHAADAVREAGTYGSGWRFVWLIRFRPREMLGMLGAAARRGLRRATMCDPHRSDRAKPLTMLPPEREFTDSIFLSRISGGEDAGRIYGSRAAVFVHFA
jgi:hypothetical protein